MSKLPENYAAQNAKALRGQASLSRREVVELLKERGVKVPQTSLRRIEEGQQAVKIEEAIAFADIFGLPLEDFITRPINQEELVVSSTLRKYEGAVSEVFSVCLQWYDVRNRLLEVRGAEMSYESRGRIKDVLARDSEIDATLVRLLQLFVPGKRFGDESQMDARDSSSPSVPDLADYFDDER